MSDEAALHQLLDERGIRRVLERYCRGVDRLDEALLRSVYHDDATDDHGVFQGSGHEFAAFCVNALRSHAAATLHTLGQSLIDVRGDVAHAETYVVAYHRVERGETHVLESFGGRYLDRLERRRGEWKISDRVVLREWDRREEIEGAFPSDAFRPGERSNKDLAYRETDA